MSAAYVSQEIKIEPPVPADNKFLASFNNLDVTNNSLWICYDEQRRGVAIMCADANGYARGDIDAVAAEVDRIVTGLGDGYTYTEYLYVEDESEGQDGLFRIYVRNGTSCIDNATVMFPSEGVVIPRHVIEEWVGPITDEQLFRIAEVMPLSSVPAAIAAAVEVIRKDSTALARETQDEQA